MNRTRQGKIARLPHTLREEVCRRLLDGQTSPMILEWLNHRAEAQAVWERHFEGAPATNQNLSEWRLGGYKDWLERRQKVDQLKTLSSFAVDLARAGGGTLSDGAAAIAAGKILEVMESAEEDRILEMVDALTGLRAADVARSRLALDERKHKTKREELALARAKFERQTVEQFLKWAGSEEARAILASGRPRRVQMAELHELMFGANPNSAEERQS